jgi:hypothetical protein
MNKAKIVRAGIELGGEFPIATNIGISLEDTTNLLFGYAGRYLEEQRKMYEGWIKEDPKRFPEDFRTHLKSYVMTRHIPRDKSFWSIGGYVDVLSVHEGGNAFYEHFLVIIPMFRELEKNDIFWVIPQGDAFGFSVGFGDECYHQKNSFYEFLKAEIYKPQPELLFD